MEEEIKQAEHQRLEESMDNSWKDEFIVLVFSFPIVINFLMPLFTETTMTEAWANLALAPEWYTTVISILVLVIFGLKNVVYKVADKLFETGTKTCKCKK